MKRIVCLLMVSLMVLSFAGCGKQKEDSESAKESATKTYSSSLGWAMDYDGNVFAVNEQDGEVNFVYQGDAAGTNMVAVSYVEDKQPQDVLYDKISSYDDSQIQRSEGYFGGGNNIWSFSASTLPSKEGSGLMEQFTAIEHNGGTILIEVISHEEADEAKSMEISDQLAGLLDTFRITDGSKQVEYDYVPGTYIYKGTDEIEGQVVEYTDTIVLNEDHSGTMTAQDTVDITWTSTDLVTGDNQRYEYKIEGDTLYLNDAELGTWTEYTRQK